METLTSPIPWLTALLAAALIIGFFVICWKTQSLHFLLRRFFLLIYGKKDIPDPLIHEFIKDQTSLHAFRLFSGIQAINLEQAHQIIDWCKQQKISISTISTCKDYFDLERRIVRTEKISGRLYLIVLKFTFLTVSACTIFTALTALNMPGLLVLKTTDRWVNFTEQSAHIAFSIPFTTSAIDQGDCQTRMPKRLQASKFSAEEIQIVCDVLTNKEWPEKIKTTIRIQRMELLILFITFLIPNYLNYRAIDKFVTAKELNDRINEKFIQKETPCSAT